MASLLVGLSAEPLTWPSFPGGPCTQASPSRPAEACAGPRCSWAPDSRCRTCPGVETCPGWGSQRNPGIHSGSTWHKVAQELCGCGCACVTVCRTERGVSWDRDDSAALGPMNLPREAKMEGHRARAEAVYGVTLWQTGSVR